MIGRSLLVVLLTGSVLCAQQPSPPPATPAPASSPSPSPAPSASPTPAPSPTPVPRTTRQIIDGLKDEDVAKALQTLKDSFLDPTKTDDKAVQRAALEGVIRRLSPGATIVDSSAKNGAKSAEFPFLAEILDSHIGYLRLGSLTHDNLVQLDTTLASFAGKKIDAVILDLRGIPEGGDYEVAGDFACRFVPKGKLLFSVQKSNPKAERLYLSKQDTAFEGVIVVLTDARTAGAAEALAGTLRLNANAMIIGAQTVGEAVEFSEVPLGNDTVLRVAVSQILLPDSAPIFPDGIKPDVAISLPREVQEQIFRDSKEKGVSQFVFETERRHMNEAALNNGTNPEIDSAQIAQRDRGKAPLARDIVLQRAVDLVTAIDFYQAKKKP